MKTESLSQTAIVVGVRRSRDKKESFASSFEEIKLLADTAGVKVVAEMIQSRDGYDNKTFIGQGKLVELKEVVESTKANLVIINGDLSPSQQKNIEDGLEAPVLDRVGLILDIFAKRAQTQEAQLQVELAQYEYLYPRLTRMWLHLSKQEGGYVGTRGPGETQLEVDKRRIKTRIKILKAKTLAVRKHHALLREGRQKRGARLVALVGYTNAGKSTLLNALTNGNVYVENKLFATLDPTVRQLYLPRIPNVVLSDTVGFIQQLPHQLVNAFKATLDEVATADLLLHVIDASATNAEEQVHAVFKVLEELGAIQKPMILVFNKQDALTEVQRIKAEQLALKLGSHSIFISAKNQVGTDKLLKMVEEELTIS